MVYGAFADLVVILHLAFILFVMFGALLCLKWRITVYLHIPAAMWGAAVELLGKPCPLTPLENYLRSLADDKGYAGDFIAHYIVPLVYPGELSREILWALGVSLIVFNTVLYIAIWRFWHNVRRFNGAPALRQEMNKVAHRRQLCTRKR